MDHPDDGNISFDMKTGELRYFKLGLGKTAKISLTAEKNFSVGDHKPGEPLEAEIHGGEVGVVIDTRLRPIQISTDEAVRVESINTINTTLDLYPQA